MHNKAVAIILIVIFIFINVTAFASDGYVTITPLVDQAKTGDTIVIKGDTSFELVNTSISRPNGTQYYYKLNTKADLANGIPVTFDEKDDLGIYTIRIGYGTIFDTKTVTLSNSSMINVNKDVLYAGDTLIISGSTQFDMVNVSVTRPNGTQYYYKLHTKAELASGISITFDTKDDLGKYTIRIGYEDVSEAKSVELKSKSHGDGGGGGGGGGGVTPTPTPIITPTPSPTMDPTQTFVAFRDIDDVPWAKESIMELAKNGVISGTSKETFEPQKTITRAEFIKINVGAFGIQANSTVDFEDVKPDDWFYPYVQAGYSAGIIKGVEVGKFAPQDNISREQAAVILYRVAMLKNIQLTPIVTDDQFQDDISDWAIEAINALFRAGIINGKADHIFAPHDNMTRAEAAKVIYGVYVLK